jgi:hypothetical protein
VVVAGLDVPSEMTRVHVPADGHCFRSAKTPLVGVLSKLRRMLLRFPATRPSAEPVSLITSLFPGLTATRASRNAPRVAGLYGLTGVSIESHGGHAMSDDGRATAATTRSENNALRINLDCRAFPCMGASSEEVSRSSGLLIPLMSLSRQLLESYCSYAQPAAQLEERDARSDHSGNGWVSRI